MERSVVASVLADPVAQGLLVGPIPLRLAYTALDGAPRVVPVGKFQTGPTELVLATAERAAKVKALQSDPRVAGSLDTNIPPQHVLLVRGTAAVDVVDGVPAEYLAGVHRLVESGEKDEAWFAGFEQQVRILYDRMALIRIEVTWAKVMDFETRIPSAVEDLAREKFGQR